MQVNHWAIWLKGEVGGETIRVRLDPAELGLSAGSIVTSPVTEEEITLLEEKPGKEE